MTKREMFELIANTNADNEEIVAFCEHEIELLANRKTSGKRTPTKTQVENEGHKARILEILAEADEPLTLEGIKAYEPAFADFKPQKMAALANALWDKGNGPVAKTYDKKKVAHFALVEGD